MMKILFYVLIFVAVVMLLRKMLPSQATPADGAATPKRKFRFKSRPSGKDTWVQVYDTDSLEEIKSLQARLEEEELECFIYEQGRKDVHGNSLKGYGIAVPKSSVAHAQKIIARMPA